jgi:enoyl-[acyl-carrier-protein] reductase (NADH)
MEKRVEELYDQMEELRCVDTSVATDKSIKKIKRKIKKEKYTSHPLSVQKNSP